MKRLPVTNMDEVRGVALELLDVDVEEGSFLTGLAIEHPFAETAIQVIPIEGGALDYVDVCVPEERERWRMFLREKIESATSVVGILPLFAKSYQMSFLWIVEEYLSIDDLSAAVRQTWLGCGGRTAGSDMPEKRLAELFTECGQDRIMLPGEKEALAVLPEAISARKTTGLCWRICEAGETIHKSSILAYFGPLDIVVVS